MSFLEFGAENQYLSKLNPAEAKDIDIPQRIYGSFVFVANPHLYSVINHLVEFDFSD